MNKTEAGSVKI